MKPILMLPLAALAGAAIANPLPPDLPTPRAGLWEMKTRMVDMGGMSMNMESCMDGSIEDLMQHPEAEKAECTDMKVDYSGNRMRASATCTIEGSKAEIVSDFTGNFETAYRGEIRSTFTPPLHGMKQSTAEVEGRWVAPQCHPGQRPGDTRMKGGVNIPGMGNIDLDSMMKNLPGMNR
jgi:hypothetical protein